MDQTRQNTPLGTDSTGGRGEAAVLDGLTPVQANKIVGSLLRRHRRAIAPPLTADNMKWAVLVTEKNMQHEDGRVSNGAVKNLIALNAQLLQMDREEWEAEHPQEVAAPSTVVNVAIQNNDNRKLISDLAARLISSSRDALPGPAGVEGHSGQVADAQPSPAAE